MDVFEIIPNGKKAWVGVIAALRDSLFNFLIDLKKHEEDEFFEWISCFQSMGSSGWPGDRIPGKEVTLALLKKTYAITFKRRAVILICGFGWGTEPSIKEIDHSAKQVLRYTTPNMKNLTFKKENYANTQLELPGLDSGSK